MAQVVPTVTLNSIANISLGGAVTVSGSSTTPCWRMAARVTGPGLPTGGQWLGDVYASTYSRPFTPTQTGTYTVTLLARSFSDGSPGQNGLPSYNDPRSAQGSAERTFTVARAAGAPVAAPTVHTVTLNSIRVNAVQAPNNGQTVEYAISTSTITPGSGWQAGTTFNENISANTGYYVFARSAQNANFNAGTASRSAQIWTPQIPTFGIRHDVGVSGLAWDAVFNYVQQNPRTVRVDNTGNQATGVLTVALSGADQSSFILSANSLGSIPANGSTTFTVRPANNLSAGTYEATVTIRGAPGNNNINAVSFGVSFTVHRAAGAPVATPTVSAATHDSITVNAVPPPFSGQAVEYAVSTTATPPGSNNWRTEPTFDGLSANTAHRHA